MSNSLFHPDYLVVPPEATFSPDPHTDDFIVSHRLKKIFPETGNSFKGNGSTIRFAIYGSGQHLDTRSVRLFFNAQALYSTETSEEKKKQALAPVRFHEWIGTLFQTIEVRLNNQTLISRIDNRNILHHMLALYTVDEDWKGSIAGQNEGYLNQIAYRNTLGQVVPSTALAKAKLSTLPQQYCLELDLENIFQSHKYIPMDLIRSINIELTTAKNEIALVRDFTDLGHGAIETAVDALSFKSWATPGVAARYNQTMLTNYSNITIGGLDIEDLCLPHDPDVFNKAGGWYKTCIDAGYEITQPYITADFYQFSDAYRATLEQAIMSTKVAIQMEGYLNIVESLTEANSHELRIRRNLASVKTLLICFELPAVSTDGVAIDKSFNPERITTSYDGTTNYYDTKYFSDGLSAFERYGLLDYQVFLNGLPVQSHKIQTNYITGNNAEHILETQKAFSLHGNTNTCGHSGESINKCYVDIRNGGEPLGFIDANTTLLDSSNFNDRLMYNQGVYTDIDDRLISTNPVLVKGRTKNHFVIGVNLEKSSQVSGSSMQELTVSLNWDGNSPKGLRVHSFLHFDQHLEIKPGFDFVIHE